LPLAAALDLEAGERVRWQLLDRSDLRLIRLQPRPAKNRPKSSQRFFSGIRTKATPSTAGRLGRKKAQEAQKFNRESTRKGQTIV